MVVLDTNILIDHLRQNAYGTKLDLLAGGYEYGDLFVSVITIQELFTGSSSKTKGGEIFKLLSGLKIWPYSEGIAKAAGEVERDVKKDMGFADAAIAATCLVNDCQLATLNGKDFAGIEGLELVEI